MELDWSPLWISIRTTLCAGVIVCVLGVICARLFLYTKGWRKLAADVCFTLPLVLPPTVAGFFLLVLCGKNAVLGRLLARLDLSLIFSWQATVLAAVVVSFPLMYRAAKGAFEQVDSDLIWAARTLGMSELHIFLRVMLPQARSGLAAGAALSFARALGEFGATLMVAGSIPGRTQTIPVAIYFATASGDMQTAAVWVTVITVISCVALGGINHAQNRGVRRGQGGGI